MNFKYLNFPKPESEEEINEIINFLVEDYGFRLVSTTENKISLKTNKYIYLELNENNKRIFGYPQHMGGAWVKTTKEEVMQEVARRFTKRFVPPKTDKKYPYGF